MPIAEFLADFDTSSPIKTPRTQNHPRSKFINIKYSYCNNVFKQIKNNQIIIIKILKIIKIKINNKNYCIKNKTKINFIYIGIEYFEFFNYTGEKKKKKKI